MLTMRKSGLVLLLAVCLAGLSAPPGPRHVEGALAVAPASVRWEYATLTDAYANAIGKQVIEFSESPTSHDSGKSWEELAGKLGAPTKSFGEVAALNAIGKRGWELVSVRKDVNITVDTIYVFKRPAK